MIDLRAELEALEANRNKYHRVYPSYITHIRFPRYKNMAAESRIDFTFPLTALVGLNGSGKTSVLNALYGAPKGKSTGEYWFSTQVDPIVEGDGSPNRFIYGHYHSSYGEVVETRKARVRKYRNGRDDPNYWEPTKESAGDEMKIPAIPVGKIFEGRSKDRWNPVARKVLYINFRKELSAFDKYFYFGKDPALSSAPSAQPRASKPNGRSSQRILTKMDQVRHDARQLARVIQSGDTAPTFRNRKIATENRLLSAGELQVVSFILGREYVEARWIRHRLFKGDGGISIVFKTKHGRYSEAFAGSGEVAVASCVVQVLAEKRRGALVLLDEPEVSLHPGAQERLLAFLARCAKQKQMQVVLSTHSPHLVAALPDDAIKTFHQLEDGSFAVIGSTHPYAAFRRLGAPKEHLQVFVEDRLAQYVVRLAIGMMGDPAAKELFRVEFGPGGVSQILAHRAPGYVEQNSNVLLYVDGDQRRVAQLVDPDTIPAARDGELEKIIKEELGVTPTFLVDGGKKGGNQKQKVAAQRSYLKWVRKNVDYLPLSCPEEIVLEAAGLLPPEAAGNAMKCKARLQKVASEALGRDASSEETDGHAQSLLAMHKAKSEALLEIKTRLESFLSSTGRCPNS